MTGWITSALVLAAVAASAAAQEGSIVVGAVISQSGAHAGAAADYRKGLLVWQDEINAAGGLLGNRVVMRIEDDGSEAVRAGEAYAELIRDGVQVLIGPYGSVATLTAAAEAERGRRVLLNAAGPTQFGSLEGAPPVPDVGLMVFGVFYVFVGYLIWDLLKKREWPGPSRSRIMITVSCGFFSGVILAVYYGLNPHGQTPTEGVTWLFVILSSLPMIAFWCFKLLPPSFEKLVEGIKRLRGSS